MPTKRSSLYLRTSITRGGKSMHLFQRTALFFAFSVQFLPNVVSAAVAGPLKAGAARVEITPDAHAIPRPFTSILDSLYARAIYSENAHDGVARLNAALR